MAQLRGHVPQVLAKVRCADRKLRADLAGSDSLPEFLREVAELRLGIAKCTPAQFFLRVKRIGEITDTSWMWMLSRHPDDICKNLSELPTRAVPSFELFIINASYEWLKYFGVDDEAAMQSLFRFEVWRGLPLSIRVAVSAMIGHITGCRFHDRELGRLVSHDELVEEVSRQAHTLHVREFWVTQLDWERA